MRIKMRKKCLLRGFLGAIPIGTVIESKDAEQIAEFKALCKVGYAVETTEDLSDISGLAVRNSNSKAISGIQKASASSAPAPAEVAGNINATVDAGTEIADTAMKFNQAMIDAKLLAILKGSVPEVEAALAGLTREEIMRLGELEAEGDNRDARKGVAKAVAEALQE